MEVRMLQSHETMWAVQLMQDIYNQCIRPTVNSEEEVAKFFRYVNPENFQNEMNQGRLTLWGAFDRGCMCGVSALQSDGHVSVLYVRPEYRSLKVDAALSKRMKRYTENVLGIGGVRYPTKKVSNKVVLGITAGVFLFVTALFAGTTVYHMATDGLISDEMYYERIREREAEREE